MTLVEKSTESIRQMILEKKYNENRFLPCEGDLCSILNVSRSTIREAVKEMEVRGYVRRIHGKGIMVIENSANVLERTLSDVMQVEECSLMDLIDLRAAIECAAVRKACVNADTKDIDTMSQYVERMEHATVMDGSYIKADLSFHIAMVKASQNRLFSTIVKAYQPLIVNTVKAASQCDQVIEHKFHYHREILNAVCAGDEAKAEDSVRVHLHATEENMSTWEA